MTPSLPLGPRHFEARVAELGFGAELPVDWIHHPLPDEELDFGNPATFVPLAVLTAPHAAIVLAVAARPAHDDGTLQHAAIAANLAEPMLERCVFDEVARPGADTEADTKADTKADTDADPADGPTTRPDGPPRWWHEALALEAEGRLDEAEQHIRQNGPFIGFACSTAELYRRRMLRLKQQGDADAARQAFILASDWIWRYASMATSGGEGVALSMEREEFRAQLVADYGSDPEARC